MANRYPWHENTIKSYEKDRLPDVDYLYALAVVTKFNFKILLQSRIETGINELNYQMAEREQLLNGMDEKLILESLEEHSKYLDSIEKGEYPPSLDTDDKNFEIPELDMQSFVEVLDDAMEPTIKRGSIVEIDFSDTSLSPGGVYSFGVQNGKSSSVLSIIRRVQSSINGNMILVSDNPNYQPQELSDKLKREIKIFGRLISVKNPL